MNNICDEDQTYKVMCYMKLKRKASIGVYELYRVGLNTEHCIRDENGLCILNEVPAHVWDVAGKGSKLQSLAWRHVSNRI